MRSDATGSSPYDSPMSWPNPRLVVVVLLVLVLVEVLLPCDRRGGILLVGADRSVAFECTPRQEAEDLQAIAEEEYRYHGAMVRLELVLLNLFAELFANGFCTAEAQEAAGWYP